MPTSTLRNICVAQKQGLGQNTSIASSHKASAKRRVGAAPAQARVTRAASSDPSVLLHVATHSDGTITYSFGSTSEIPPATATIQLETHAAHREGSNGSAAPAAAHANGSVAVASAAAAAQQLDKLLHLNPQLGNGRAGHSNKGDKPKSHRLETAAEAAASHTRGVMKKTEGPLTSRAFDKLPVAGGPSEIDYAEASAPSIDRMYSRCCDAGRLDEALVVVKGCIRAGRKDALKMLKHYKFLRPAQRQKAVRRAMRFVQLLPRQFVDARTYNMLLSVCAEAGDIHNAMLVADMLRAAGHRMDTILYTNLIKACAAAGDAEQAFQLFSEMKATGIKTEKQVYATLISACSEQIAATPLSDRRTQLVLLERAFALVEGMHAARINPDAPVWNALVTAAGRAGQLQRSFDVLEDMLASGVRPNARTYGSLIDACARTGDKELALRVYGKAQREGHVGELLVYSAAINACVKAKGGADLEAAMGIYADMQRAGVAPDSALFGALMMAAGQSGDLTLALDLEAEMEREGLQPCSGTESALLSVHLLNGRLPEAQGIYRRLRAAGVAPHIHAANALLNAFGKELRLGDVVALLCDMVEAGLKPDAFTFAAVLGACQRSDECELGLDVYRAMRLRGVKIDNTIGETLLRMCYNRLRQSWRPGGYPPQRLRDEDTPGSRGAHHVPAGLSSSGLGIGGGNSVGGSHRAQERAKLLAALIPPGRKLVNASDNSGEVPWQSHAFHIYRETLSSGVKPSMRLLNLMFACLRVPWEEATGGESDQSLSLAVQTQRLMAGIPQDGGYRVQGKIGIEGIYHSRAISILEEAIVSGLLPSFKAGASLPVDLRALPPSVAEVYVLTVVAALQRQVEARRELTHRIVFLVPRYDGHRVFMPSFLGEDGKPKPLASTSTGEKSSAKRSTSLTLPDSDDEGSSSDDDVFGRALREGQECTGDERTGLGVAGVLRRLRLWAREYSPEGLIVVEPREVTRWAKMIQREVEKRSASALALQKPYGQRMGSGGPGDLYRQSSSIRMGF